MEILFENRECLACVKEPGILSQKGKPGEKDMVTLLQKQHSGFGGIYLIHRLDKEVGGVMVFGKTHGAAELLASASENHKLCKEYLAVVQGVPEQAEGELKDYLARSDALRKTVTVDKSFRGAKEARLSYRVVETKETAEGALTLVQIRLHTGRNHQIRVQFSSRGLPIVGDERYGSGGEQMALWAFRLTFPDPCGGNKTVMKLPSGGVWEQFSFENVR